LWPTLDKVKQHSVLQRGQWIVLDDIVVCRTWSGRYGKSDAPQPKPNPSY